MSIERLALGCLMLPIVIRTTDQMLLLVPQELREGSYALGSRRARTIRTVVLPSAAAGIVSGALLAIARAAGETAPLLFTIGFVNETNWRLFHGQTTALSVQISQNARSAFPSAQERAWGAALTLIVIVFITTLLARIAPVERWGIPEAIGHGWSIWFKGGWRPPGGRHNTGPVTHQAALLEHRRGERLALAVLTDEPPWGGGGFEAVEGVARRLLATTPPYRGGWVAP